MEGAVVVRLYCFVILHTNTGYSIYEEPVRGQGRRQTQTSRGPTAQLL